jgi:hypothetical protein
VNSTVLNGEANFCGSQKSAHLFGQHISFIPFSGWRPDFQNEFSAPKVCHESLSIVPKDSIAVSTSQPSTCNPQPFPVGTFALKFFAGNTP